MGYLWEGCYQIFLVLFLLFLSLSLFLFRFLFHNVMGRKTCPCALVATPHVPDQSVKIKDYYNLVVENASSLCLLKEGAPNLASIC